MLGRIAPGSRSKLLPMPGFDPSGRGAPESPDLDPIINSLDIISMIVCNLLLLLVVVVVLLLTYIYIYIYIVGFTPAGAQASVRGYVDQHRYFKDLPSPCEEYSLSLNIYIYIERER